MNILVVEDNKPINLLMCKIISDMGHHYFIAQDGEQAIKMYQQRKIDLILMDVEMPGMDGLETTRQIRELAGNYWVPIIFISGHSSDEELWAGIEAGGDDYLSKPVNPVILKAKILAMERIVRMRDQLLDCTRQQPPPLQ